MNPTTILHRLHLQLIQSGIIYENITMAIDITIIIVTTELCDCSPSSPEITSNKFFIKYRYASPTKKNIKRPNITEIREI